MSSPVGLGFGALSTRRMPLPIAHPTASSKNAVAGSSDDEKRRATTTSVSAVHHTFRHFGPVVETSTVTIAMAVARDASSFHANLPRPALTAAWEKDAGSIA